MPADSLACRSEHSNYKRDFGPITGSMSMPR
jgi:hypothetical protein